MSNYKDSAFETILIFPCLLRIKQRWSYSVFILLFCISCSRPSVYRPPAGGSLNLLSDTFPDSEDEEDKNEKIKKTHFGEIKNTGKILLVETPVDARPDEHRNALSTWLEEHGGYTGEAMTRDRAYQKAVPVMAGDILAELISETGKFEKVLRVRRTGAEEGDYILSSRIRRLRGWQAYRSEKKDHFRVIQSLGDVFIDEIKIIELESGKIVFLGQTGALLEELTDKVDPYERASAAFIKAAVFLAKQIAEADLKRDLEEEVSIGTEISGEAEDLPENLPLGWRSEEKGLSRPAGWSGTEECMQFAFEDNSRLFFHPRLDFYYPGFSLWFCPDDWKGEMDFSGDSNEKFPARVIGFDRTGNAVLWLGLGKSSWPDSAADLFRFLELEEGRGTIMSLPQISAE